MKKLSRYAKNLLGLLGVSLALNLIACAKGFCDWYGDFIYPVPAALIGRLTGGTTFAVGELLMYLGITLVLVAVLLPVLLLIFRKRANIRRFARGFYKTFSMLLAVLLCLYTVLWLVPLRGSLLGKNVPATGEYTLEYVLDLRNRLAEEINIAAYRVPRNEDYVIQYPSPEETEAGVRQGMEALSVEFPRLKGYSPPPKPALCSDVLDWMGIGGFTIPCTMETILNKYSQADRMFAPGLYAHELAHHHGFYKESEADFLGPLACMKSDDPLTHYAGLVDIWYEVDEAFWMLADPDAEYDMVLPDWIVQEDLRMAAAVSQEVYESDSHPLERFEQQFTDVAEVGWHTQADILKEYNYDGSIALTLWYFQDHHP